MEITHSNENKRKFKPPKIAKAQSKNNFLKSNPEAFNYLFLKESLVLANLGNISLRTALLNMQNNNATHRTATDLEKNTNIIESTLERTGTIQIEKTFTIQNRTPEYLFKYWRNLENLPIFMKHLQSVRIIDSKKSHWTVNTSENSTISWDADIVFEIKNDFLAWASSESVSENNLGLQHSGFARFENAPYNRGTEVKVVMEYVPPGGALSNIFARLLGEDPKLKIIEDLRRFKMLMETGELATTHGQSSGPTNEGK